MKSIWGFSKGREGREIVNKQHNLWAFLVAQMVKNLPAMTWVWYPGSGRSPGDGNGNPLQYSRLENSMRRGAWQTSTWGRRESNTTQQLTHTHTTADHPTWKPAEFSKTRAWSINVILEWPEILNVLLWTWSIFTFFKSSILPTPPTISQDKQPLSLSERSKLPFLSLASPPAQNSSTLLLLPL